MRRFDLPSAAPGDGDTPPGGAGPESVLFFQEQSVLRTVCFADQYLHASQRVTASMRVHIKARAAAAWQSAMHLLMAFPCACEQPRVAPQGGGMMLIFMDGAPKPPRDAVEERTAAAAAAAKVAAAADAAAAAVEAQAEADAAEAAIAEAEAAGGDVAGCSTDAASLALAASAAHMRAASAAVAAAQAAAAAVPPPPPPAQEAMTIQLDGASFYPWPKVRALRTLNQSFNDACFLRSRLARS